MSATVRACSACLLRDMRATYWAEHGSRCHRCGALCCEHTCWLVQGQVECVPACDRRSDRRADDALQRAAVAVADELMCDVAGGRGGALSIAQRRLLAVLRASGWEPMPKMMPGYEPYTREEYARITAMVGSAAEATEVFDEDERFAAEPCCGEYGTGSGQHGDECDKNTESK